MAPGHGGNGLMTSSAQELRELAYELLRRIEHELDDLGEANDSRIAATVAECERVLADIKEHLPLEN